MRTYRPAGAAFGLTFLALTAVGSAQDVAGTWRASGDLGGTKLEGTLELEGRAPSFVATLRGKLGDKDIAFVGSARSTGDSGAGQKGIVIPSGLNVRAQANREAAILRVVSRGTVLDLAGAQGDWLALAGGGFVSRAYVEVQAGGRVRTLELGLVVPAGVTNVIAGNTPENEVLLSKLVRTAELRFDGAVGSRTRQGGLTLERDGASVAEGRVRFVFDGTSLPVAASVVTFAEERNGRFARVLDVTTDARGEVAANELARVAGRGLRVLFGKRAVTDGQLAARAARSTLLGEGSITRGATVGLVYSGPRLDDLASRVGKAGWNVGSGGFRWNGQTRDWESKTLDCISSALFGISYATDLGAKGQFEPFNAYNMIKLKDGRPFVPNTSFRNLLSVGFGTEANYERLSTAGSVYRGVCAWPWAKMRWGWEGTSSCGCGLHATPRQIKDALPNLGEMNVLSMTQAKMKKGEPMSTWSLKYEYSVLLVYRRPIDGKVFACHSGHWRTFEAEVDYWASDSWGSAVTDCRYMVFKLAPDTIDPSFWLDGQGRPFTPADVGRTPSP